MGPSQLTGMAYHDDKWHDIQFMTYLIFLNIFYPVNLISKHSLLFEPAEFLLEMCSSLFLLTSDFWVFLI